MARPTTHALTVSNMKIYMIVAVVIAIANYSEIVLVIQRDSNSRDPFSKGPETFFFKIKIG